LAIETDQIGRFQFWREKVIALSFWRENTKTLDFPHTRVFFAGDEAAHANAFFFA
jgi:hypothetical protein